MPALTFDMLICVLQCFDQVTVLGTTAEEGGGGKIKLINADVFDDIDVAMMAHGSSFSTAHTVHVALQE